MVCVCTLASYPTEPGYEASVHMCIHLGIHTLLRH